MEAAAHDPAFARKTGVPQTVAREFVEADQGKHFPGKKKPSRLAVTMAKSR